MKRVGIDKEQKKKTKKTCSWKMNKKTYDANRNHLDVRHERGTESECFYMEGRHRHTLWLPQPLAVYWLHTRKKMKASYKVQL